MIFKKSKKLLSCCPTQKLATYTRHFWLKYPVYPIWAGYMSENYVFVLLISWHTASTLNRMWWTLCKALSCYSYVDFLFGRFSGIIESWKLFFGFSRVFSLSFDIFFTESCGFLGKNVLRVPTFWGLSFEVWLRMSKHKTWHGSEV